MGKKHSQAPMHLTRGEWAVEWGGKKEVRTSAVKSLPFDCCALSFTPFEHPVCAPDGAVFDLLNIMPFIAKYKTHPLTGEPLSAKQLTKLTFHRNADGKYHCPVLFKPFNEWTAIVAIKPTGHVYSQEAVQTLCVKPKNMRDLLTEHEFTKDDIITLNDPRDDARRRVDSFAHVRNGLSLPQRESRQAAAGGHIRANAATARVLALVAPPAGGAGAAGAAGAGPGAAVTAPAVTAPAVTAPAERKGRTLDGPLPVSIGSMRPSTHHCAAGFTSTVHEPVTRQQLAPRTAQEEQVARYTRVRSSGRKAYVRLATSLGALNLELHADLVPRTVENFVTLAKRGYYDGCAVHRLIKNFMMQAGDPTGTGSGGESSWGASFADEFIPGKLSHSGRGIVSMANSGPNSNKSQFFITFKSCTHLDGVHAIFGRVVGGLDVLAQAEVLPTDKDDRPKAELRIVSATVFVDPFETVDAELRREGADGASAGAAGAGGAPAAPAAPPAVPLRAGVGMFIAPSAFERAAPRPRGGAPLDSGAGAVPGDADRGSSGHADESGSAFVGLAAMQHGDGDDAEPDPSAKRAKRAPRAELGDFSAW